MSEVYCVSSVVSWTERMANEAASIGPAKWVA